MRLRYDVYIEFDSPREGDAITVLESVREAFSDGVMGVSDSSLYEDKYVFTSILYLDLSFIFDDIEERFPNEIPDNSEEQLEECLRSYSGEYVDVVVQRVPSSKNRWL